MRIVLILFLLSRPAWAEMGRPLQCPIEIKAFHSVADIQIGMTRAQLWSKYPRIIPDPDEKRPCSKDCYRPSPVDRALPPGIRAEMKNTDPQFLVEKEAIEKLFIDIPLVDDCIFVNGKPLKKSSKLSEASAQFGCQPSGKCKSDCDGFLLEDTSPDCLHRGERQDQLKRLTIRKTRTEDHRCYEIVAGKSMDKIKLGMTLKEIKNLGYRFTEANKAEQEYFVNDDRKSFAIVKTTSQSGKIVSISSWNSWENCYLLNGKIIPASSTYDEMKPLFPNCAEDTLTRVKDGNSDPTAEVKHRESKCNGFRLLEVINRHTGTNVIWKSEDFFVEAI